MNFENSEHFDMIIRKKEKKEIWESDSIPDHGASSNESNIKRDHCEYCNSNDHKANECPQRLADQNKSDLQTNKAPDSSLSKKEISEETRF